MRLASGCPIRVSFRTATVRARLMRWAKVSRGNGSGGACGAIARNRTRPFGTAAEYTAVPLKQAVRLPDAVPLEQGA